jgi:hypothetical protein
MRRCIGLVLLLANGGAYATEVVTTVADGRLGVRVEAVSYPETLPKELTSGLTNRLYARVSLQDATATIDQRTVEIAIRYDLWDEKFSVVRTIGEGKAESHHVNQAELDALLAALPLPGLFELSALPAARDLTLRVELLLNPIDREKLHMIRKWVAQNSTPSTGPRKGISSSNTLFNQIFEQYAKGSEFAAVWRIEATSRTFRVESLTNERR